HRVGPGGPSRPRGRPGSRGPEGGRMATFRVIATDKHVCELFKAPGCPNLPGNNPASFKTIQQIQMTPPVPPVFQGQNPIWVCTSCLNLVMVATPMTMDPASPALQPPP